MKRVGWGGVAVLGWLLLGLVGMWVTPEDLASPGESQLLFGSSPSMQSSAPSGVFAFARLLEHTGFAVGAHLAPGPPDHAVWVLLEPNVILSAEEVAATMEWLAAGGRLVYAPKRIDVTLSGEGAGAEEGPEEEQADEPEETGEEGGEDAGERHLITLDDPLIAKLSEDGRRPEQLGATTLWRVGSGMAAVPEAGAAVLSNASLSAHGLGEELTWLNVVLAGRQRVVFDEARLGAAPEKGALDLLRESHYGTAVNLALVAVLVGLVAFGVRRQPPQSEPAAGGRVFGEHLDAVGRLLAQGERRRLAALWLLSGTRRRLGGLAASERASVQLEAAQAELAAGHLVRAGERLRQLETRP